jgi:hypothetical protein
MVCLLRQPAGSGLAPALCRAPPAKSWPLSRLHLRVLQALVPWFGMKPPVQLRALGASDIASGSVTAEQASMLADASCPSCKCHHGDAMKMASLFFALRTFAEGMVVAPSEGDAAVSPLQSLQFDDLVIRFQQPDAGDGNDVAVVRGHLHVVVTAVPLWYVTVVWPPADAHSRSQALITTPTFDASVVSELCGAVLQTFVSTFGSQLTGVVTSVRHLVRVVQTAGGCANPCPPLHGRSCRRSSVASRLC